MYIKKMSFIILSSIVVLGGCDTKDNKNTIDPSLKTGNPCLDSTTIDSMKKGIIEKSKEIIKDKFGEDVDLKVYTRLDKTKISFSFITKPTKKENGDKSCSAKATVEYVGDDNTTDKIVEDFVKLVHSNIKPAGNVYANILSGYQMKKTFESFGVNEANIGDFSDFKGNSFATKIDYDLKTTYSEDGEKHDSYEAKYGHASAFLATTALIDQFVQVKNKDNNTDSEKVEEYSDDEESYNEHPELYEDSKESVEGEDGDTQDSEKVEQWSEDGTPVGMDDKYFVEINDSSCESTESDLSCAEMLTTAKKELNSEYNKLKKAGKIDSSIDEWQTKWVNTRNSDCGEDKECLAKWTMKRTIELKQLW